jgi:hypothetical protein
VVGELDEGSNLHAPGESSRRATGSASDDAAVRAPRSANAIAIAGPVATDL